MMPGTGAVQKQTLRWEDNDQSTDAVCHGPRCKWRNSTPTAACRGGAAGWAWAHDRRVCLINMQESSAPHEIAASRLDAESRRVRR